jgi:hypothetical protein
MTVVLISTVTEVFGGCFLKLPIGGGKVLVRVLVKTWFVVSLVGQGYYFKY